MTSPLVAGWLFVVLVSGLAGGELPAGRWTWGPTANTWRQSAVWRDLPLHGPLVQLELLNRDRLSGELRRLDESTIELRTAGGCLLQFPRQSVLSLQQSTRWDVTEFRPGKCGAAGQPCQFDSVMRQGRLTGWLHSKNESGAMLGQLSFSSWSLPLRDVASTQTTANRSLHRLLVEWDEERVHLYLDGALLVDEQTPADRTTLLIRPADHVELRDVVLSQPRTEPVATLRPLELPLVGLDDGGELAAETIRLVDHELELTADGTAARWKWSSWNGIAWPAPQEPVPAQTVAGWLVELELQPLAESPGEMPDRLTGAITRTDQSGFQFQHALLGSLPLQWSDVRSLKLRGWGSATPLRLGPVHLGDEIRLDLRSPMPEGYRLTGLFAANRSRWQRAWLELEQADLEPAGPETPPASPFLAELRSGQLVTQLLVNLGSLGTLNNHLRWKAAADRPERLVVPLPSGLLQQGENSWELREHPQKAGTGYDDWELWNLMLYETWP